MLIAPCAACCSQCSQEFENRDRGKHFEPVELDSSKDPNKLMERDRCSYSNRFDEIFVAI